MIKHIKMRCNTDCNICSVAMLLNKSYEEVIDFIFPVRNKNTDFNMDVNDLSKAILNMGFKNTIKDFNKENIKNNGILNISYIQNDKKCFHYIVYNKEIDEFFNPSDNLIDNYTPLKFIELI